MNAPAFITGMYKGRAEGGGTGGGADGLKVAVYTVGGPVLEAYSPMENCHIAKISNETPTIAEVRDGVIAVRMDMAVDGASVPINALVDGTRVIGLENIDDFGGWVCGNFIQCVTQEAVDDGSSIYPSAGLWVPGYVMQTDELGARIEHTCMALIFTWRSGAS